MVAGNGNGPSYRRAARLRGHCYRALADRVRIKLTTHYHGHLGIHRRSYGAVGRADHGDDRRSRNRTVPRSKGPLAASHGVAGYVGESLVASPPIIGAVTNAEVVCRVRLQSLYRRKRGAHLVCRHRYGRRNALAGIAVPQGEVRRTDAQRVHPLAEVYRRSDVGSNSVQAIRIHSADASLSCVSTRAGSEKKAAWIR